MSVAADQFSFLQEFVFERSAIVLSDSKAYLVESRLRPIARTLGMEDVGAVVAHMRQTRDRELEDQVIDAMTTNETLWFRDQRPFNALRKTIIPQVLQRNATVRRLSIWSAACSSGQELYSVAMLLEEDFPQLSHGWNVSLFGTDLNGEMTRRAAEGVYSKLEVNRGLPASLLVRYFTQEGMTYRVRDSLRKRARFQRINLATTWPTLPNFDVILLRNVLIYFDIDTKRQVLARAGRQLAPGGGLILGAAETTNGLSDEFETVPADGAVYYRVKPR
jgi:chemotaxis protein methyltransferase CheR